MGSHIILTLRGKRDSLSKQRKLAKLEAARTLHEGDVPEIPLPPILNIQPRQLRRSHQQNITFADQDLRDDEESEAIELSFLSGALRPRSQPAPDLTWKPDHDVGVDSRPSPDLTTTYPL
jgi:hypothetical protein